LRYGADLAIDLRAHVDVLLIVPPSVSGAAVTAAALGHACVASDESEYQRVLKESITRLRTRGIEANGYLGQGRQIDVIAQLARKLASDLIVVGHYPRPEGGRWWSGADRASLAESVTCSVLIAQGDGESVTG
jgi:nucleotide-binding universal stress UspA family protein